MGRKPEKEVIKLTFEELNEEIRKRKICSEVLRKLFFIKEQRSNCSQSSKRSRSKVIGYGLENWNEKGFGLKEDEDLQSSGTEGRTQS